MVESTLQTAASGALEVLAREEILGSLARLIEEAAKRVWLVSPYTSLDKLRNLTRSIQAATRKGVVVSLVVREPDNSTHHTEAAITALRDLVASGLKLYALKDLHAKIYVSERHALVTSLNLLDSSFNNSIEIGMLVPSERTEFARIRSFFTHEIQQHMKEIAADTLSAEAPQPHSAPRPEKQDKASGNEGAPKRSGRRSEYKSSGRAPNGKGYCIACRDRIPLNPDHPYCPVDYADSEDGDREEYCHECGKEYSATLEKPLCKTCFKHWDFQPGDEDAPF